MENDTLLYFSMLNLGHFRYLYFILSSLLYCAILFFNVTIILAIFIESALHQPMYILIACLSINSLYGTTGFFPRLLTDLLLYPHSITRAGCHVQTFVLATYISCEFTILTSMAYDRFVAISKPLQYHSIMTPKVLIVMIAISGIYPMISVGLGIIFTARLRLCGNELRKLYCNNWVIANLSCEHATFQYFYGFALLLTTVLIPFNFILYSYIKILMICQKSSKELKSKAYHTCLPHIVTFVNYSLAIFCETTLTRIENLPPVIAVILSLEFLIIPPLLNPVVYGLNFPEIRRKIQHHLKISKKCASPHCSG